MTSGIFTGQKPLLMLKNCQRNEYILCNFQSSNNVTENSICCIMPRLHLIHVARIQVVCTCIPCCHLHVSCIGDKPVVMATCIHLYPQVEHCLELVSVDMYLSTCRRIQVARPGYLYPATCIWCKCGFIPTEFTGSSTST